MKAEEKFWLAVIIVVNLGWISALPLARFLGKTPAPGTRSLASEKEFLQKTADFIEKNQSRIAAENFAAGKPVTISAPPGDIYLVARDGHLSPFLNLQEGGEYRLHILALGSQHSFILYPQNLAFHTVPREEFLLQIRADTSMDFLPDCDAFCSYTCPSAGEEKAPVGRIRLDSKNPFARERSP